MEYLAQNALVDYSSNDGALMVDNCSITYPNYWDNHYHYWHSWYPAHTIEKSKVEQGFKIVGKLMEKGIVKNLTVKKFIVLVNEIAEIL